MKIIKLPFINELDRVLAQGNHLLKVVIGPRQVGKTTTVKRFLEEKFSGRYLYESADLSNPTYFDRLRPT